jgi:dinuclear metal center YbgI/SA1388 family protein
MKLESILQYVDEYLSVSGHPDYPTALNGLQVDGPEEVRVVACAVDASQASIARASELGADLMMVHHGLFWDGPAPLVGARYRRVKGLIESGVALYSCHLPLDGHPEIGNCALLAKSLSLKLEGRLGAYKGIPIGWWGRLGEPMSPPEFTALVGEVLGGPVHVIPGGGDRIERVGVLTGGGASFIREAADLGLDAYVTGEGPHQAHFDAIEYRIHVLFGGHYATETFGVRALGSHLAERFDLEYHFIDQPTGL